MAQRTRTTAQPSLTSEQITQVDQAIRSGVTRKRALKAAGISAAQYRDIEACAARDIQPYESFLRGMDEAEATAEATFVTTISSSSDWRAAAFLLERRFPEQWGQKIQIEVQKEVEHILDLAEKTLDPAQFALFVAALSGGGEGADDSPATRGQSDGQLPN